jgi:hypothetical protein
MDQEAGDTRANARMYIMTRHIVSALAALALAACAGADTQIASNTVGSVAAPAAGTTVLAGGVSVSVAGGSAAAAVGAAALLGTMFYYDAQPLDRVPPPLLEGRRVNEHDCTTPLVDYSANLRCR